MKMLKNKHNKKGVTLVEVVVAMSVLSVMSVMIIMALTYALKANATNYKRSTDVDAEGVFAETFDTTKTQTGKGSNVERNPINSKTNVKLNIDFGGSNQFNIDNVHSYKAKLNNAHNDVKYQLKFLQGSSALMADVDPNLGQFFVVFYNDSTSSVDSYHFAVPETGTSQLFSMDDNNIAVIPDKLTPCGALSGGGSSGKIGFIKDDSKSSGYFAISSTNSNPLAGGSSAVFTLNSSNFDKYAEKNKDGSYTGLIVLHYVNGGHIISQKEYDKSIGND